ncbi:MAG: D-alanyl-D-alanine carboxypeptidase family protein [Bacillota bacterium]|nr:D-alanyl-D-alanine carboxypeptidase family protein [Bacillota bacterium]
MKKRILILAQIFIIAIFSQVSFAQPVNIAPDCSYILMDSKTGQVLLEHNADVKVRPASTTKLMTAIVALENGKLDSVMNVSAEAVNDIGPGGMNIGIMAGESNLTLENLLNVMLVRSANETANIIAENISGSRAEFVKKMNEKAKEIGATNTNFVNPCGKDDAKGEEYHLSTARDMALITRYAMTKPEIRQIVAKEFYKDLPATNKHQKWDPLQSTNKLLWYSNKYPYTINNVKYSYTVNGVKTGYTSAAGNNLLSSAVNSDGLELISVVMHVTGGSSKVFSYTKELYKYGFENYTNKKIISSNQVVKNVSVEGAKQNEKLDLIAQSDFYHVAPLNGNDDYTSEEHINNTIKAPVKKGDVLGTIEYKSKGMSLGSINLIASSNVEKAVVAMPAEIIKKSGNKLSKIIIAVGILGVIFLIFRFVMRKLSRRARKIKSF